MNGPLPLKPDHTNKNDVALRFCVQRLMVEIMQSLELHTEVVPEAATEKLLENKGLGSRIKRLRLKRSMGLVELGQAAGLSASYLSQLETGRVIPTIRNLMRLAMVHKVDIAYFSREKIETKQ